MNATPTPRPLTPESALARFVDLWSGCDGICEITPILQCSEVDALADVFRAGGKPEEAEHWVAEHRAVDPECDCQREERAAAEVQPCEGCGADAGEPCIGPAPCPQ